MPELQARVAVVAQSLWALAQTGIIRPYRPQRLFRLAKTLARWGTGVAGGYTALAARMPDAVGIEDELGSVTFDEIHRHSNAIGRGLEQLGVAEGDTVAVLCRNHRWFVEATVGVAKLGADVLFLNTALGAAQMATVLQRERPIVIVHDEEFARLLTDAPPRLVRLVAWRDTPTEAQGGSGGSLGGLVAEHDDADLRVPERESGSVILTSGTTGSPRGARRGSGSLDAAASLVSRLPLRHGMRVYVAAPLFHSWGWAHLNLSMLIGSTLLLRRRFDPEQFLDTMAEHRIDAAAVVPVMLQRVLALPEDVRRRPDLSGLRLVAASGSALAGDLATRWMDEFGDHLYNVYGSTECAWVAIATPDDLRAHPGTAGRAPLGTTVRLYDPDGRQVVRGSGRVFVGNSMLFDGYTDGPGGVMIESLMGTGDVGRLEDGLLFIERRDDEMIVSGGENVNPRDVEDCIARRDDVLEVAAIGVDDDEFGARLRVFVVPRAGADLDEKTVLDHVRTHLARHQVPREVWLLTELPRNETGKVLTAVLRQLHRPTRGDS